jgi:hypothetical protein
MKFYSDCTLGFKRILMGFGKKMLSFEMVADEPNGHQPLSPLLLEGNIK